MSETLRKYGIGGQEGNIVEDKRKCIVAITDSTRATLITRQCNRGRGYGPDGLYCEIHSPKKSTEQFTSKLLSST